MGSNMDGKRISGSRLAVGAIPRLPARAAARSDKMSACRFVATMVSRLEGFPTMRVVIASTSILSQVTSGNSLATSVAISSHITMPCRWALDFVTTVSSFRGRSCASLKANRMIRVTPRRVKIAVSVPTSSGKPRWARPPCPAYSPSEFSRTMTQSRSPRLQSRKGEALADRQPQTPERYVVRDVRPAYGAKVDRIEVPQAIQSVFWHHRAVFLVIVRAPGKLFYIQMKTANLLRKPLQYLKTRSYHFGADAIPRVDCNRMLSHLKLLEQIS